MVTSIENGSLAPSPAPFRRTSAYTIELREGGAVRAAVLCGRYSSGAHGHRSSARRGRTQWKVDSSGELKTGADFHAVRKVSHDSLCGYLPDPVLPDFLSSHVVQRFAGHVAPLGTP